MTQQQRQSLLSTLAKSRLSDINRHWQYSISDLEFEFLRKPETGMVMIKGRTDASGSPFNLGEATVTRCAINLEGGYTGIGYVLGRQPEHATTVALIDAMAQRDQNFDHLEQTLLTPLRTQLEGKQRLQQNRAALSRVEFFTMIRGEDQ